MMSNFAAARLAMVDGQLRPNKVTDMAVIQAFLDVPRERFVPDALRGAAYIDEDLPVGGGRYLMEPMLFARMLQIATIRPGDVVLEIGAGTGYGTAILAKLTDRAVSVESDPALAARAREMLTKLGLDRAATVIDGPLERGYPERAPYDAILFSGAVGEIPEAITAQLADGGRLLAVVKEGGVGIGKAVLMLRANGVVSRRVAFDAATPLLPGFVPQPGFVF
ncbi:MAG TPA: protein-L-isoaspartate O-methyltransferase [Stellaceae bacterium]|jgi:protein-L-isoaspartate(D-aspartate) O-methyltransferase